LEDFSDAVVLAWDLQLQLLHHFAATTNQLFRLRGLVFLPPRL
jgi:hypothetical protein